MERAVGELVYMYARLGRMTELEALLKSVEGREFVGAATERITGAREGLWMMQHKPEVSFKCGPYALQSILLSDQRFHTLPPTNALMEIFNFPSTQKGVSLPQVAGLSRKVGLNYQMAFRNRDGAFQVPSVVHWKVGHYAAMVRQEGERYLLEDPTFGNTVWATRQALEAETSGYFLIPSGDLPPGWRRVDAKEGAAVWGKGFVNGIDSRNGGPCDPATGGNSCVASRCGSFGGGPAPVRGGPGLGPSGGGMAVSRAHLTTVSLNLVDTPVGYSPPVGFPVQFTVRYSQREAFQPANFTYANFGPKWTCDWISYITENPSNALADVNYYIMGGGTRTFTGFNTNSQTFNFQQFDQTQLKRTGVASYEMLAGDGSKAIFSQSDGAIGTSRKVFLTQLLDPFGNALTLAYDGHLRLAAITDAIGQVTTLTYGDTNDTYKITRVTDPFGRFAAFEYDAFGRLTNITDVIGLSSAFTYAGTGDFVNSLITPYGTNLFLATSGVPDATFRSLETVYADGSRDRVEFNQIQVTPDVPAYQVPDTLVGVGGAGNVRNTFYWSRTACATAYGDYTKAKIFHWLHSEGGLASGCLSSVKEPLENWVFFNYVGANAQVIAASTQPTKIGRVLDDGQSQVYTYAYNGFGHVTNSIDPVGRTFSYLYASNGIDLLEVRQTRAGNNELLFRATYNSQHLPLTRVGADGQTNSFTYNARGQLLTETNPKNETTSYTYDTNGYLIAVDGPLPGTNDVVTATYDTLGRTRTKTDESGYTLTFDHDDLDRLTKVTHPDGTFEQFIYHRLDVTNVIDRAGRQTTFEFDNVRQMKSRTDPLKRVTRFEWCRCGAIKSLTDPMGRTTSWITDVQSRPVAKVYGDGSQVQYLYENASSRVRHVVDEKGQISQFSYNLDDRVKSVSYANAVVPTPGVSYSYDPNYSRPLSMTDGTGTTWYAYHPVTDPPTLGANQLASVDGPLQNDTITYDYDELGWLVSTAINGVAMRVVYDAAGRLITETNALGTFTYAYDGASGRMLTNSFPNGLTVERGYGGNLEDHGLQRITHRVGTAPVSEFIYGRDPLADRITTWSQQAGEQLPELHTFGYDEGNQLLSDAVTNVGALVNKFAYVYDPLGNRLAEQVGGSNYVAGYNALNQITSTTTLGASRTNEWDANDRLVAINAGDQRAEFTYDGVGRLVGIRSLINGVEVSLRKFLWCDNRICEERDGAGAVTKRFFEQGMRLERGRNAGNFFHTRDHLGSIRELTDVNGNVRARYAYDPYGRRTRLSGDLEADAGFAGMFWIAEAEVNITRYRAYDPESGRWLSRDPLADAELEEGPNLYTYVADNPVNATDPLGLCCEEEARKADLARRFYARSCAQAHARIRECEIDLYEAAQPNPNPIFVRAAKQFPNGCKPVMLDATRICRDGYTDWLKAYDAYLECTKKPCRKSVCQAPVRPQPLFIPLPDGFIKWNNNVIRGLYGPNLP